LTLNFLVFIKFVLGGHLVHLCMICWQDLYVIELFSFYPILSFSILLYFFQPPFTADDRKRTMDKIIKGKLILPAYLTVDARELIRNVS
jgi:hypothetical protein